MKTAAILLKMTRWYTKLTQAHSEAYLESYQTSMIKSFYENVNDLYSKLIIKTPKRRIWRRSGVFIVKFEHKSLTISAKKLHHRCLTELEYASDT